MNVFRIAVILLATTIFASPAIASRLFGPSIKHQGAVEAAAAEVELRVATPDYTLLPSLAAKITDTMEMPTFTLDLFDDGDEAANAEHRFGLIDRHGIKRPAFQVLSKLGQP